MNRFKKSYLFFTGVIVILIASCKPAVEHLADCSSTSGSYVCYNDEGRDATYARWNFDTVQTFNAFDIQGGYPPVPGTTGPWTVVNITLVNSTGSMGMEMGDYTYKDFLVNEGQREFTFWIKRYEGDDQNPDIKNFIADPAGAFILTLNSMDASGKLSGVFEANVVNMNDASEKAVVKYRFTEIPLQ